MSYWNFFFEDYVGCGDDVEMVDILGEYDVVGIYDVVVGVVVGCCDDLVCVCLFC